MKKKTKIPNASLFPPSSYESCRASGLNVLPNAQNCGLKFESFFMFSQKTFSILLEWFCLLEIEMRLLSTGFHLA